jgi:two-component system, chemotaxis family, chemotaxis protein CheY
MKLLVAEDDDVSRMLMCDILQALPAKPEVIATSTGAEAWSRLIVERDVVLGIFDVMMPEMDGLELLGRVRGDPRFAGMPVILCTALNDRVSVTQAAALAVDHYLVKPFTRAGVVERVSEVLERRRHGVVLESPGAVCARLEIDAVTHRSLLNNLLLSVARLVNDTQRAVRWSELRTLAIRANALRGACLNLGVPGMAAQLAAAETAFGNCELPLAGARSKEVLIDPAAFAELAQAVERIEREALGVKQGLAALAA